MPLPARNGRTLVVVVGAILLVAVAAVGFVLWKRGAGKPPIAPGTPQYEQYAEAFQVGVAALDSDVPEVAEKNLTKAVELIPDEPAGWANRGLLHLRSSRLQDATADLEKAKKLAPDNADIQKLIGLLEQRQGKFAEAAGYFRKATDANPRDIEALYRLAQIIDQEQKAGSDGEYQKLMERILAVQPNNLHVLIDRLRIAARRSDKEAVKDTLDRLRMLSGGWTADTRKAFAELEQTLPGALGQDVVPALLIFSNLLKAEPGYARGSNEVAPQDTLAGTSLQQFLRLEPVKHAPAVPDAELAFAAEPLADAPPGKWEAALPVWLTGDGNPAVVLADAKEVRRVGSGETLAGLALAPDGLIPIDWDNDFRTDLVLAGPGGVRFFRQYENGTFADVTKQTGIPGDVLGSDYAAALARDIDLDGDLDLVLARRSGPPVWLRNNFDGTFAPLPIFPEVNGARAFAWADLDNDGAPDAAIIDSAGRLHVYANERSGQFPRWPAAPPDAKFLAATVADADDDGVLDLVLLRDDGAVVRLSDRNKRQAWDAAELARWSAPPAGAVPGSVRLFVGDLDNNGVPDILASGPAASAAWLGAGGGKFQPLAAPLPPNVTAVADLAGTGRLDLLALDAAGRPIRYANKPKKAYHWQVIRPKSAPKGQATGDNRINSFGIGGEIELRTGTHVVKQPVDGPTVHFGLGERTRSDVARILWPNGVPQVEFNLAIDTAAVAEQRLKGSCPFLFAWDGSKFAFVTDFMWSTPLGMYINAQDKGGFLQTSEWVKIRGDQLAPKDGFYELRVNANLWETHFFDHLALHAIDHPVGTELFADERFALEPMNPTVRLLGPTRPVAKAWDHRGADAADAVRADDGEYLDRAGRGIYQGITNDHWVEVDLGDDAPREGPVWLVARGWVHPTDSSVNYALEQGKLERPRALVLEVPDGQGGWKVAKDKIGFPAGKNKTVLLRLDGPDGPGVVRRFRLRTNMEIYWDSLKYAVGRDDAELRRMELPPASADLRFRGILAMSQANPSSPELPHYDRVVSVGQPWRDLIGYHTRFGDIRELLEKVDDRYAILTAGDEVVLRFPVPDSLPPGWARDFLWVSDGWVKDGDLNTRFGKTVQPLPAHNLTSYERPPGGLEGEPVFRQHRKDWDVFHTRYVTPHTYERGLRTFRTPPGGGTP